MSALPRWLRSGRVLAGLPIVVAIALFALFAPFLAPHDPDEQNLLSTFLPPAWAKGATRRFRSAPTSLGRCVLSRLHLRRAHRHDGRGRRLARRDDLGAVLAHIAGYFGGWIDWLIGRTVDVWMSFPPVILSLILMVGLGPVRNVILAIVLVDWTRFCRVLRAEVLVVTRRDYVAAARLVGFTHCRPSRAKSCPPHCRC